MLDQAQSPPKSCASGLFALTGQSNVTGAKASFASLDLASRLGFATLLDAAALAPTTRIELSKGPYANSVDAVGLPSLLLIRNVQADKGVTTGYLTLQVALSLYKMIGYPTGVGALVIKHSFLLHLRKDYFSGGTVSMALVNPTIHTLHTDYNRFEVSLNRPDLYAASELIGKFLRFFFRRTGRSISYQSPPSHEV